MEYLQLVQRRWTRSVGNKLSRILHEPGLTGFPTARDGKSLCLANLGYSPPAGMALRNRMAIPVSLFGSCAACLLHGSMVRTSLEAEVAAAGTGRFSIIFQASLVQFIM